MTAILSPTDQSLLFPPGFMFGTATAAYQIEGAIREDGRGPSVWDTFSHQPGRIGDGTNGDVTCDSYHRCGEDAQLSGGLGAHGYRFSISWSRVQPAGSGRVNPAGLDYYSRLVDALLEHGVVPVATLFHWDLPQGLQDVGGWPARDTADRFAEYAGVLGSALGDRVGMWITLNEPVIHTLNGHVEASHAPGLMLGTDALQAAHHMLLGHGKAVAALRAAAPGVPVGLTNNYSPTRPDSDDEADIEAAHKQDVLHNWHFTDPVLLGRYPQEFAAFAEPAVRDGDMEIISTPLDFLGVNYYFPEQVRADADGVFGTETVEWPAEQRTAFDWPVVPERMFGTLTALAERYGDALPPIYVTENGAAFNDVPEPDGTVHDPDRIAFLASHLAAVRAAIDAGVPVRGYFTWSLMDNFEWAEGFSKRFGLVHVDFETRVRTEKSSYTWFRDLIAAQSAKPVPLADATSGGR